MGARREFIAPFRRACHLQLDLHNPRASRWLRRLKLMPFREAHLLHNKGSVSAATAYLVQGSSRNLEPGVILTTALALLMDPFNRSHPVWLLIDPGSEISLLSVDLVSKLRLCSNMLVSEFGDVLSGQIGGSVFLKLRSRFSQFSIRYSALVNSTVISNLPAFSCTSRLSHWNHLKGLQIADPHFSACSNRYFSRLVEKRLFFTCGSIYKIRVDSIRSLEFSNFFSFGCFSCEQWRASGFTFSVLVSGGNSRFFPLNLHPCGDGMRGAFSPGSF